MLRPRARISSFLLTLLLLVDRVSFANDTMATLEAGGLVPAKSSTIVMESESLNISVHRVTVDYVFRNIGKQDIDAVVAFPLPELSGETVQVSPIELPSKDPINFMSFKAAADGVPISPRVEIRAFKNGRDITDRLRSLDLPVSVLDPRMKDAIERLPLSQRNELIKDELIVYEESGQGTKSGNWIWPWWQMRVQFYWIQHFAANSLVKVSHTYLPVVGGSYVSYDDDGSSTASRYCGTSASLTRIKDVKGKLTKKQETNAALWEKNIRYILTTANNWSGPIRNFHMEINSDGPDDIVLTCMPSVKEVTPTRYQLDLSNFHPDRELDLTILQPNK